MEKTFHNSNAIGDQHSFELIDLLVASLPFLLAGDPLHPLDQDAPVPGAIEHDDLAGVGKLLPEALKVVLTLLVRQRRRNRIDFEASRIHSPAEPPNNSTLACGVPSFEDDHRPLSCSEIGLLDGLHSELH